MSLGNRHAPRCFCIVALAAVVAVLGLAGCRKKGGDAVVPGKEYVPAAQIEVTPDESESPAPTVSPTPFTIDEKWIVHVEMVAALRKANVCLAKERWETLKAGDRVHMTYREGKYTGTVWSADLD